ncbi:MAG TPA: AMP-binding protein, partial [Xanthobacteraceae bacterium]|nr:AMP-binding protein [Xanthobacteraceae bacterium]
MNEPFDRLESAVATATLDGIFRLNARRHPDGLALIDPPNRPVFTGGTARQLSYVQAEHAIAALATRLRDLALPQGCAVGLQLPNTVESIVAILAAISAGLVPAPLPLLWQPQETVRALRAIDAGALITCGRVAET